MPSKRLTCTVLGILAVCLLGAVLAGGRMPWWQPPAGILAPTGPGTAAAAEMPATAEASLPPEASIEVTDGIVTGVRWDRDSGPVSDLRGVLGSRYVRGDLDATDVTGALWRSLDVVVHPRDGSLVEIQLLRPLWWLQQEGIEEVGDEFALSIPEMDVEGTATVLEIGPCPADSRENGPGEQVVIGTFARESPDVWDLHLEGQAEPIGVTGAHPFWSVDRRAWVPARALRAGEALDGMAGVLRVARLERRPGRQKVYNLEVHREHAYRVGSPGVLVHNNYLGRNMMRAGRYGDVGTDAHHIVALAHPDAEEARMVLRTFDIGLDDAINGVWLPRNSSVSRARGALHNEAGSALTSEACLKEVNKRIRGAAGKGRAKVLRQLQKIRHDLLNGTFPGVRTIR
ncbi:MAG TPA: polymorphic toxin-type HINT domain-containing protein [Phycisphaerae bacterium]|nr:polymorphic toxin-type HINT domain-containing protein [Phycisphaerae bacterium]